MFSQMMKSLAGLWAYWQPESVLTQKFRQANDPAASKHAPLQGSVSTCFLDDTKKFLTKSIRVDRQKEFEVHTEVIRRLPMAHVLNSWAECARLEFDLQSEFEFHQSFLVMWKDHASISVPTLIAGALSEDRKLLSMGYVAWPRWADVFVSDKDRARKAMTLVATFFFDSISKEGLVHGDISPFNVLVNREGPLCVCMIDYGLCRRMSADEIGQLVKYSKEKSKSASMLSSVWSESGQVFGSRLWSSLQGCLMDDPFAKIDGVFVRSLLGMTRMACDVEYVNELGFHIIQRS